jgi:hypothetical protein
MITNPPLTQVKTGIGYSQKENSFEAGAELAANAVAHSTLAPHTLFLLFATPDHESETLVRGVRSVVGNEPSIIGGTTIGILTSDFLSYTGSMAGCAFLSSNEPFFKISVEENIKDREFAAGSNLAKKINEANPDGIPSLLLLYDSVKSTVDEGQIMFHLSVPLLEGMESQLKQWPVVAGVGVMGEMNMIRPCAVWVNEKKMRHGLLGVTIAEPLKVDTVILSGTRPTSGYHTITKAADNIIYEIDNKPALEIIDSIMGGTMSWDDYPLFVTLGVNNGDKFGEFNAENYSNRFCIAIDKEQKALVMVETDLKQGQEVQLMKRDFDFKYIQPQIEKLFSKLGSRKPLFAFYIDCIGRVSAFSGMPEEESLEVIRLMRDVPCFGVFSGVEITNIRNTVKPLDWTGVLCLFSQE